MAIRVSTNGKPSHVVKGEGKIEPLPDPDLEARVEELVTFQGWLAANDVNFGGLVSEGDFRAAARIYLGLE